MLIIYLIVASIVSGAWVYWQRVYYDVTYGDFDGNEIAIAVVLGMFWPVTILPTVAVQAAKYFSDRSIK